MSNVLAGTCTSIMLCLWLCIQSYRIHKIIVLEQDLQQVSQHALWICPPFRAKQEVINIIIFLSRRQYSRTIIDEGQDHLDGGHQMGRDQLYDTPPSPVQPAPKSFRDWNKYQQITDMTTLILEWHLWMNSLFVLNRLVVTAHWKIY